MDLQGSNLAQLIDKLRENRFNLVVLGAFKRGKSTLINALLGESILPTAQRVPPGVGRMMGFEYTLYDSTFALNWDIVKN